MLLAGCSLLLLAGCSTMQSINPVNWWHDAEGGKIAEQRPAPPGADQPYPNLANVPARPAPPDRDAMQKLTSGLIADRQNAQYTAAAAPLADPSLPSASPGLFGTNTLPPPPPPRPAPATAPGVSTAVPAASAPPPAPASSEPAAPPAPAPVKPVASAPLAAPEAPADSAMPAIPAAPPPPALTPEPAAAPPPRPMEVPQAAPAAAVAPSPAGATASAEGNAVSLAFDPGSSALLKTSEAAIRTVAAQRKGQTIVLTGYGDAPSSAPEAQANALTLAMARAQAVASALQNAGVPASAIRVGGEAAGRGVTLRLLP